MPIALLLWDVLKFWAILRSTPDSNVAPMRFSEMIDGTPPPPPSR